MLDIALIGILEGLQVFEWLYFRLKGPTLFNASYFAAFLYYEQDNTAAIAYAIWFYLVKSIFYLLYFIGVDQLFACFIIYDDALFTFFSY